MAVFVFVVILIYLLAFVIGSIVEVKKNIKINKQKALDEETRKKAEDEKRKIALAQAEQKRKEDAERKILEELKYENITVVYATVDNSGKPEAIAKRNDNTYVSIERQAKNATPYELGEILKLEKEKINNWYWYNETEYQRQLTKKQKADLQRQQKLEKQQKQNQNLNRFGINYLYHMTHKDNLHNILQNGLKSHNQARTSNLTRVDIADNQVNDRRSRREPIYNRSIHDYVPLYFNPKNPMLFRRSNIQNDIVILAIDRNVLYQENIIFTDGNAAANATSFYNNPEELSNLSWNCINAEYWNDIVDGKRLKCSEVLVYPNIPTSAIQKIFCNNEQTKMFISSKLNNFPNIETEINSNLYFRGVVQQQNFNDNPRPFNNRISIVDLDDDLPF